jgi:hypothetical protein
MRPRRPEPATWRRIRGWLPAIVVALVLPLVLPWAEALLRPQQGVESQPPDDAPGVSAWLLIIVILIYWLVAAAVALGLALVLRLTGYATPEPAVLRPSRPSAQDVRTGLLLGVGTSAFIGLLDLWASPWEAASRLAFCLGVVFGLFFAAIRGFRAPRTGSLQASRPVRIWRQDLTAGLAVGAVLGLFWALIAILVNDGDEVRNGDWTLDIDVPWALLVTVPSSVVAWMLIAFAATHAGALAVTAVVLRRHDRAPARLLRFLEDAHRRGVLRQVGAVYQFRHARLQDHLAEEHRAQRL